MEVYLIRHTTPDIAKGICYGQSDIPLKPTFEFEAEQVLKRLPGSLDAVYTSPLIRCSTLASLIETQELQSDERLMELSFGNWEMCSWDSIPQDDLDTWMRDFVRNSPPEGESMIQLQDRVMHWWEELLMKNYSKIAVVTHAGVIRVLKSYLDSIPLDESFDRIKIDYGDVVLYNDKD